MMAQAIGSTVVDTERLIIYFATESRGWEKRQSNRDSIFRVDSWLRFSHWRWTDGRSCLPRRDYPKNLRLLLLSTTGLRLCSFSLSLSTL